MRGKKTHMNNADRRTFFKIAGTGVVAAGGVAFIPSVAAPVAGTAVAAQNVGAAGTVGAAEPGSNAEGALVAFVSDVKGGEIVVMVEGREVVITDHAVVAALSRAVHATAAV